MPAGESHSFRGVGRRPADLLLAFTEGPANEYSGITYTFGVGWSY